MIHLSQRAREMQPSATLAMDAKAKKLAAAGHDVVSFATGEPDFETPRAIREAGKRAIDEGLTRYGPSAGLPELRSAIREKFRRDNGLDYADDEVTVACGAKQLIYNALQVLVDPGDEVIIPTPYWVSYPDQVRLAGGVPVFLPTTAESAFRITAGELAAAITPRTRAIILNYPSNPSGSTYSAEGLAELADALVLRNIAIISDEIYEKLLYGDAPHASIAAASPKAAAQTIVVNGVSKAYAMTGWRLGYAAGRREVVGKLTALASQQTSCVAGFVQRAAATALSGPQDEVVHMREEFRARRDLMLERLSAIPGITCHVPDGAFYLLPNVEGYLGRRVGGTPMGDATRLADYLLEEAHLATVSGDPFGAPGHLRFSYAASRERIEEGMRRLASALAKLA